MNDDFYTRLAILQERIKSACERVGRNSDEVSILAVAKTFKPEDVIVAADNGLRFIGENKVQEARQKIPLCPGHLEWHMIGHLQSNKVREAVSIFYMIHSVDSWRLLEKINDVSADKGRIIPVCIEVNVSGEASKYGIKPEEVSMIPEKSKFLTNVNITGLMTIPPFTKDSEGSRPFFIRLRELRDDLRERFDFPMVELSMGMSNDFEIAIEEGATWIRVGSLLFGDRKRSGNI